MQEVEKVFFHTSPKEGERRQTLCGLILDDGKKIAIGIAACSLKDRFLLEEGRRISSERAEINPSWTILVPEGKSPRYVFTTFAKFVTRDPGRRAKKGKKKGKMPVPTSPLNEALKHEPPY